MPADAPAGRVDPTAILITDAPEVTEHLIEQAGYVVVGRSDTAVNGERLVAHHRPDLVVVEHALRGEQGWDALPHLHRASPASKLMLVITGDGITGHDTSVDGCVVVTLDQLRSLAADGADLRVWIDESAAAEAADRRSGRDRRTRQDWSVVGFEKRGQHERRGDCSP